MAAEKSIGGLPQDGSTMAVIARLYQNCPEFRKETDETMKWYAEHRWKFPPNRGGTEPSTTPTKKSG